MNISDPTQQLAISVSVYTSGNFIFPDNYKLVSGVFHISCADPFPATIKIQHCVNSRDHLKFAVSSDDKPPYYFSIITSGEFVDNFGRLKVSMFSFFGVVWDWFFPPNIFYNIFLTHSKRPNYQDDYKMWNLDFYVFRKMGTLEECFHRHIGEDKTFLNLIPISVELEEDAKKLTFQHSVEESFLELNEYAPLVITRKEIETYGKNSGRPPGCKMRIKNKNLSCSSFTIPFKIIGVKEPLNVIKFHWPIWGKVDLSLYNLI